MLNAYASWEKGKARISSKGTMFLVFPGTEALYRAVCFIRNLVWVSVFVKCYLSYNSNHYHCSVHHV